MAFFLTFSEESIQAGLEDWIYECNTPAIQSDGKIVFAGVVKLTEDEQSKFDELKKLKELSSDEDDSQLTDFYDLQLKRGVKATITIAIQEVDSLSKQIPKVEVTFNGSLPRDKLKKF